MARTYVPLVHWRGRGLASRAVRLASHWAASQPGVRTVELRIDQDLIDSQHVAANAGFVVAGTVTQFVPCTGETFEDLRYVLQRPPPGGVAVLVFRSCRRQDPGERAARDRNRIRTIRALPG